MGRIARRLRDFLAAPHGWVLLLIFGYLILLPRSLAPIKDEGGYLHMAMNLPQLGFGLYEKYEVTPVTLTLLAGAHLFMVLAGKSVAAARWFVLLVCIGSLAALVHVLRRSGVPRSTATVFVAIIAVNPLMARYAHTFETDGVFTALCLLALVLYAGATELESAGMLLLGSLAATLAIYTRQPGVLLPVAPAAVALLGWLRKGVRPRPATLAILAMPYLAFLPLSIYFHVHSGSWLMYVTKTHDHPFGGWHPRPLLWGINFIGFFSLPFFYTLVRGHWAQLKQARGAALLACGALAPLILWSDHSVASMVGGLGRIFVATGLPLVLIRAFVVACQFSGLVTLWLLVRRAWAGRSFDLILLVFTALYLFVLVLKGGLLLVHYASPLIVVSAWLCAESFGGAGRLGRALLVAGVLFVGAFSAAWSTAESALGSSIHRAVTFIERGRQEHELVLTASATAIQMLGLDNVTFSPQEATFGMITPEDGLKSLKPSLSFFGPDFRVTGEFPAKVFGRSLGTVIVLRRQERAGDEPRAAERGR